jgi:DNA-binding transcriptional regulator YiaG
MTTTEFRAALATLGYSLRGFAAYVGANERTVRRWALGEQDIPAWVPVLLGLMQRLAA